jgi:hypothetical protein
MNFTKPENSNFTFKAGNNPSTGDLDVTLAFREDIPGRAFGISEWIVTDKELEEIIRTRKVYLSIMGVGMPPVNVFAFNPFTTYGYYPAELVAGKLVDPREDEQFGKWMKMIEEAITANPFFTKLSKNPTAHVDVRTWRQIYKSGGSLEKIVTDLICWVQRHNAKQN